MSFEIIVSILSIIGIGSVIGAFFTYFWQKKKEMQMKENQLKENRYLCILLLMYGYINKEEFKRVKSHRTEIQNREDLKKELQTEWVNSWIFAGDNTIKSFKNFLENPNETTFAKTVLSMRKELWNKKSNYPYQCFQ